MDVLNPISTHVLTRAVCKHLLFGLPVSCTSSPPRCHSRDTCDTQHPCLCTGCPSSMARDIQSVFPDVDLSSLSTIPTCQRAECDLVRTGDKVDTEKDRLLGTGERRRRWRRLLTGRGLPGARGGVPQSPCGSAAVTVGHDQCARRPDTGALRGSCSRSRGQQLLAGACSCAASERTAQASDYMPRSACCAVHAVMPARPVTLMLAVLSAAAAGCLLPCCCCCLGKAPRMVPQQCCESFKSRRPLVSATPTPCSGVAGGCSGEVQSDSGWRLVFGRGGCCAAAAWPPEACTLTTPEPPSKTAGNSCWAVIAWGAARSPAGAGVVGQLGS